MKTMITRNNVPRHNGTMRCPLGRNGLREFRVITLRHGPLLRSSERKRAGAGGSGGSHWEAGGRQGRGRKGCGRVGRGAGGPEEVRKVMGKCGRGVKAQEVTVRYRGVEGKWALKRAQNSTFRWWKQAVHQKRAVSGAFWVLKGVVVFEGRVE